MARNGPLGRTNSVGLQYGGQTPARQLEIFVAALAKEQSIFSHSQSMTASTLKGSSVDLRL